MIRGMDISSYPEMRDRGYRYYDEEGNEVDVLRYAVKRGFNYARLRIWNEPENIPGSGGYCNLEQTIKMAQQIRQQDIGFLLDFHYSDWWADPGNQRKPLAWENLSVEEMETALYKYTKVSLEAFEMAGVYPDMIQIGNEIRTGMLFPEGAVPQWKNLARFINAGIRAVRNTQGKHNTRIILHLDQGGKHEYFREWFDHVMAEGVLDFDIIGLSYYPFWHGTYFAFRKNMDALADRYGKEVLVAETAHAYRKSGDFFREEQERAAGFPANQVSQRKVMELIISIIASVKGKMGLGFFYWEPFMRAAENSGGWGSCMGLMDEAGRPTEGLRAISYEPEEDRKKNIAKIYCPGELALSSEERLTRGQLKEHLPKQIMILFMDGTTENKCVSWDLEGVCECFSQKNASCYITGRIDGVASGWNTVSIFVFTADKAENLLKNGEFQNELEGYDVESSIAGVCCGTKKDGFWYKASQNFQLELKTEAVVEAQTVYQAELLYRGGNTTGTNIEFFGRAGGEYSACAVFPEEAIWNRYRLEIRIPPEVEKLTLGIKIDAPAVSGEIREIRLEKRIDKN